MATTQTIADSRPETARPARVSRETSRLLPIVAPVVFAGTLVCVLALSNMAAYEPSVAELAGLAALLLASTFVEAFPAHTPARFERRVEQLLDAFRADRRDLSTPDDPLTNRRMTWIAETLGNRSVTARTNLSSSARGR